MHHPTALASSISALQTHHRQLDIDSSTPPAPAARSAQWYAEHSRAPSTMRWLNAWWRLILELCEQWSRWPLPMDSSTAACIVAEMADRGYGWGSIRNVFTTIRTAHRIAGHPDPTASPTFSDVFEGVARTIGVEPANPKQAIVTAELRAIAREAAARTWPHGVLEWALITLGYYGALRRSEITALDVSDVEIRAPGMRVLIASSKTDQYGQTEEIFIDRLPDDPTICAVAALEAWLQVLDERHGPLFRRILPGNTLAGRICDRTVCRAVKRYANVIGADPSKLGAHSLRAGCVTQMKLNDLDDVRIAAHTRHRSLESLKGYYRPGKHRINLAKALAQWPS